MSDWLQPELKAAITLLTEPQIVALVLYGESRSEPVQGIVAVGCVIRNRVRKPAWWGHDFAGVCLQPWQFSCLSPKGGAGNYKKVLSFAERMAKKTQLTNPLERQCAWVAQGIVGDYVVDVVKGATHYHTKTLTPRPEWAMGHAPIAQIGAHVFYDGMT